MIQSRETIGKHPACFARGYAFPLFDGQLLRGGRDIREKGGLEGLELGRGERLVVPVDEVSRRGGRVLQTLTNMRFDILNNCHF